VHQVVQVEHSRTHKASAKAGRGATTIGAVAALACGAPMVFGQAYLGGTHPYSPEYRAGSAWDRLEPIDPGAADLGPLGLQARVLPTPLRLDQNFGMLYRAMAPDGSAIFARRDGGITAVFPRSAYVGTPMGDLPLIPPDTRFIIGEPGLASSTALGIGPGEGPSGDPSNGLRLDGRMDPGAPAQPAFPERERSARVGIRALLERAARRERASGSLD